MSEIEGPNGRRHDRRRVLADEVIVHWVVLLRACQPWNEMFLDDVAGEFRPLLVEFFRTADAGNAHARAARIRHVARAHGAFRRRQGCPAYILSDELIIAEEAIRIALMRSGADPALVTTVQDSLSPLMRAVERAEYSGYADVKE